MYFKLLEKDKVIGNKYRYKNDTSQINEIKELKNEVENGTKLNIYKDGEWISGKEYFKLDNEAKDEELEQLKLQAKELKIKNYWVMNKETLKEKIAEVQE